MSESTLNTTILRDLGGGLILRRSTPADAQRLGEFNARIHGDNPRDAEMIATWTQDLLLKPHPTFHTNDFVLVEDVQTEEIVSTLNLIDQTWMYEGIPFGVGRPELVGTDPNYRNRGLVRAQFEVIHQWSLERGQPVQAITGIPFFYRQFGYEMGLNLGGERWGYEHHVPKLKEGEEELYTIRVASEEDIPWLMKMYARECRHSLINTVMNEALWRLEICGKSAANLNWCRPWVIETKEGEPVGYLARPEILWGKGSRVHLSRYELDENVSYRAVTPSVVRQLWSLGLQKAGEYERKLEQYTFGLGAEHPAYLANPELLPGKNPPYAYYVRVPDLPAFLRQIAPALEKNLALSAVAGHTGELKINFYRSGLKMVFEKGKLASVEGWKPIVKDDEGKATFPNLTFLQLLFGYRTVDEIRYAYADCWASPEAHVLLDALFPKKASNIWVVS